MLTQTLKNIKQNRLFKNIKDEELNLQLSPDNLLYKLSGDVIYKEGDPAENIFLIVSGEVGIAKERLLGMAKRVIKKSGDFFGEEDFLENMPRTSSAYANKESKFFVLKRTELEALITNDETISDNLKRINEEAETEEQPETIDEELNGEIKNAGFIQEDNLNSILNETTSLKEDEEASKEILSTNELKIKFELSDEQMNLIFKEVQSINDKIIPSEIFKSILNAVQRLTHAEGGILYLVNKEQQEIRSKAISEKVNMEIRLKSGEGVAGLVLQDKNLINIADVQSDSRFSQYFDGVGGLQIRNIICAPIMDDDEIAGLFYLVNCKYGDFNEVDEKFLEEFSSYALKALKNAEAVEALLNEEKNILIKKMNNYLVQEIKKPILISKKFAEHLKTKNPPAEFNQALDMQLEQINLIADTIQSLSDYTENKKSIQMATYRLNDMLNEILGKFESTITIRNCQLEKVFDRDVEVKVDKKEFALACLYIIRNSCDAMPEGGKILITTKLGFGSVVISFKDDGKGMPAELKEKVFEPFVTYEKEDGTGLGLTIVRSIVENNEGKVNIESNLKEGTTVIIMLPMR